MRNYLSLCYLTVLLLLLTSEVRSDSSNSSSSTTSSNNSTCDDTCATCSGSTANDCLSCPTSSTMRSKYCDYSGYIMVNDSANGSFIGYISKFFGDDHRRTITQDIGNALNVNFSTVNGTPFDINIPDETFPYLGWGAYVINYSPNLSTNGSNWAFLGDTKHTAPNSSVQDYGPNNTTSLFQVYLMFMGGSELSPFQMTQPVESAVWSLNSNTNQLITTVRKLSHDSF